MMNVDYEKVLRYSKIVDDFVKEHKRTPYANEFTELGGNSYFITKHFGKYSEFLESLGYGNLMVRERKNKHGRK